MKPTYKAPIPGMMYVHMTGKDFTEQSTVNSLNLLPKTSIQDAGYKIAISILLFPLDAGGCDRGVARTSRRLCSDML